QEHAYAEFKKMMGNTQAFVESVKASDLPPSFRVVPRHPELLAQIGDRFKTREGVKEVVYGKEAVDSLLKVTRAAQLGIFFLAGVLLLSASLLILNTIRMAIYSRRREVALMKLVGATNWFIRIPFMVEGMIQGLTGALIACGVVFGLRNVIHSVVHQHHNTFVGSLIVSSGQALHT